MDIAFLLDIYLESVRRYQDGKCLLLPIDDHRIEFLLFNTFAKTRVGVRAHRSRYKTAELFYERQEKRRSS